MGELSIGRKVRLMVVYFSESQLIVDKMTITRIMLIVIRCLFDNIAI